MDDSETFINEYDESNIDLSIYLEIKNKNIENIKKLNEYLESEDNEFEFIINFPLTEFNHENIEKNINKSYKFKIYIKSKNIFKKENGKIIEQKIDLKMPEKYYYDDKIYNDNYFVFT